MQGSGPQSPLNQGPTTPGPFSPGKTPPHGVKSVPQSPMTPGPMSPPGYSNPESVQGAQSILSQQIAKLNLSGLEWDR